MNQPTTIPTWRSFGAAIFAAVGELFHAIVSTIHAFLQRAAVPARLKSKRAEVERTRDLPLPALRHAGAFRTVLVIDRSDSMDNCDYPPSRLTAAKTAAKKYLRIRGQRSPQDQLAVVAFSRRAECVRCWTVLHSGMNHIVSAIDTISTNGATSLGAGLSMAEQLLLHKSPGVWKRLLGLVRNEQVVGCAAPNCVGRVIVLTDGGQNSAPAPRSIAKRLKDAGIIVECIGIGAREEVDEELLKAIASVIDGRVRYRYIGDNDDLLDQFGRFGGLTR